MLCNPEVGRPGATSPAAAEGISPLLADSPKRKSGNSPRTAAAGVLGSCLWEQMGLHEAAVCSPSQGSVEAMAQPSLC